MLNGEDGNEVLATVEMPPTKFSCGRKVSLARSSMRRLRLDWMYENKTFLWLNDEVAIRIYIHAYIYLFNIAHAHVHTIKRVAISCMYTGYQCILYPACYRNVI